MWGLWSTLPNSPKVALRKLSKTSASGLPKDLVLRRKVGPLRVGFLRRLNLCEVEEGDSDCACDCDGGALTVFEFHCTDLLLRFMEKDPGRLKSDANFSVDFPVDKLVDDPLL